ncbi:type IV toxin-antitoxin system AbiEi family antitoxin domain-containing protein [Nocardia thailandica]|uniref:Type IV toxin-antitoxin system AbiEi family antitoxin domain-containing protein n=1 Tax=Nocardia thailandica TaxID=257275 RepID=A0ABW6PXN8_9NOCA
MSNHSRAASLISLASEQWGLVTSRQAGAYVGASPQQLKKLADSGMLERVRHGMYRVARFPYDQHQDLRVAWMALDPDRLIWQRLDDQVPTGVVSHRSAALVHGLGDVDADQVELTCQRRVRLNLPDAVIHRGHITRDDWVVVDGLAVTTPLRTIADLAESGIDAGHLAGIVRDTLARGLATSHRVTEVLAEHAFSYGYTPFDGQGFLDALIETAGVPESAVSLAQIANQQAVASATDPHSLVAALNSLLPSGQFETAVKEVRHRVVRDSLLDLDKMALAPTLAEVVEKSEVLLNAAKAIRETVETDQPTAAAMSELVENSRVLVSAVEAVRDAARVAGPALDPATLHQIKNIHALVDPTLVRVAEKARAALDPTTLRVAEEARAALDPATLRTIRAVQRSLGDSLL